MVNSLAARPRRRRRIVWHGAATARAKPTSSINGLARNSSRSAALILASRRASAARPSAFSISSASREAILCRWPFADRMAAPRRPAGERDERRAKTEALEQSRARIVREAVEVDVEAAQNVPRRRVAAHRRAAIEPPLSLTLARRIPEGEPARRGRRPGRARRCVAAVAECRARGRLGGAPTSRLRL